MREYVEWVERMAYSLPEGVEPTSEDVKEAQLEYLDYLKEKDR